MIVIGTGSADRNPLTVDGKLGLAEQSASFGLVIGRDLFAQLDGEFRLVPGADLNSAVAFGGYRQRLVGEAARFLVAHIGAEVTVVHVQMINTVVADFIIIHGDTGCTGAIVI